MPWHDILRGCTTNLCTCIVHCQGQRSGQQGHWTSFIEIILIYLSFTSEMDETDSKQCGVTKATPDIDFGSLPFTADDYDVACRVLKSLLSEDHADLYNSPAFRPFRVLLQPLLNRQKSKMYDGQAPDEYSANKKARMRRSQEKERMKVQDRQFIEKTILRAGRMKKLEQISQQHDVDIGVPLLLDGVADDGVNDAVTLSGEDHLKVTSIPCIEVGGQCTDDVGSSNQEVIKLNGYRGCYICKRRYQVLHHFYDTLCEECASLNWEKRMQVCDLTGRIVLVTGGRVKIGFQTCLKLLRCGAVVIATSRFPGDTALRYAMQKDYLKWKQNLHIFGIDLRDLVAIEELCTYLEKTFPWLDCIINNVRHHVIFTYHV